MSQRPRWHGPAPLVVGAGWIVVGIQALMHGRYLLGWAVALLGLLAVTLFS